MGRPPIGKRAMTTADRQRRNRAKHPTVTKPVTKATERLTSEIDTLRRQHAQACEEADQLRHALHQIAKELTLILQILTTDRTSAEAPPHRSR